MRILFHIVASTVTYKITLDLAQISGACPGGPKGPAPPPLKIKKQKKKRSKF